MSVVGIDFGSLNTVVAVVRNRGVDVIVNEVSNRATPSLVSFGDKQRYLGESAKTQEISNFKNTVGGMKRLIGRSGSDSDISKESRYINANVSTAENNDIVASVNFKSEQKDFTFSQMTAMFLSKVKEYTAAEIKAPVTDAVISCPTWYTDRQRRALIDAAKVVGIRAKVMNDNVAAAYGYGLTKTDLPDPEDPAHKPRIVVFADLGYSSFQVSVVSFVKGKLCVLGTAYDRNLGGRDFDDLLLDHYIEEFSAKYKIDLRSNKKAQFRLRGQCERVKKILSANSVTLLNVECLMDDKDVSAQVTRSDLEEWAGPFVKRLEDPIQTVLKLAGVTAEDIDSVEMIGGSMRTPIVKSTLSQIFGESKLSTTLNMDEAVARGCALRCANGSPTVRVRDFVIQDWNGYPIEFCYGPNLPSPTASDGHTTQQLRPIFGLGDRIKSIKNSEISCAISPAGTIKVQAYYGQGVSERQFTDKSHLCLGQWEFAGVKSYPSSAASGNARIKFRISLGEDGIVDIEKAEQLEEVPVTAEEEKIEVKEGSAAEEVKADETKKATKIKLHPLKITALNGSVNEKAMQAWKEFENQLFSEDKLVIDTAERRNALEEYVYDTRSKLEMGWSEYILESQRTAFMKELSATEDWLYGEGEDATKSLYQERLDELKSKGEVVRTRVVDAEERPYAERLLREYGNSIAMKLQATDDRYAHIPAADLTKVKEECMKKNQWLNDAVAANNAVAKHENAPHSASQFRDALTQLQFVVTPILNRPKPVVKEPKPAPTETKPAESEAATTPAEGTTPEAAAAEETMDVD